MILNTGSRTDIPAFYAPWFCRRIQEGSCLARNPYYPGQVLRYRLDPSVVDVLVFCTKNPNPMLEHLTLLSPYCQLWYVTITPYGEDIEPFVPPKEEVMSSFRALSRVVGERNVIWRYDPILLTEKYTVKSHLEAFASMAEFLEGATERVVISFLDLYEKTKRNFPEGREVPLADRYTLAEGVAALGKKHHMKVYTCLEQGDYARFGIDTGGCMSKAVLEAVLGEELEVPSYVSPARPGCRCLLGNDIGAYNTCLHGCRYCYANADREIVLRSFRLRDPSSPFLL